MFRRPNRKTQDYKYFARGLSRIFPLAREENHKKDSAEK
jgi:hypothetical protein